MFKEASPLLYGDYTNEL